MSLDALERKYKVGRYENDNSVRTPMPKESAPSGLEALERKYKVGKFGENEIKEERRALKSPKPLSAMQNSLVNASFEANGFAEPDSGLDALERKYKITHQDPNRAPMRPPIEILHDLEDGRSGVNKGVLGIGKDISESGGEFYRDLKKNVFAPNLLGRVGKWVKEEPWAAAKQFNYQPGRAVKNSVAGLANATHGLVNAPSNIAGYLAKKDIVPREVAKRIPRLEERDYGRMLGVEGEEPGDNFIRNMIELAPYIAGGEVGLVGKGMSRAALQRSGALAAHAVTQDEDPVKAGLGYLTANAALKGVGKTYRGGKKTYRGIKKGGKWLLEAGDEYVLTPSVKYGKRYLGNKKEIAEHLFGGLMDEEIPDMLANKIAAEKLGLQLTPGEASGNPLLAAEEAAIGVTSAGERNLYKFTKGQRGVQHRAVNNFVNNLSRDEGYAGKALKDISKEIIDEKNLERLQKAAPLYEKAYEDLIPYKLLRDVVKDSNVRQAWRSVRRNSLYKTELLGAHRRSIKVFDQVKKHLDSKIEKFAQFGTNKEAIRILTNARNELVDALDKGSPTYKKARSIYAEDSPAITALEEGNLGKIANLPDRQIKNVSKIIFDPTEMDLDNFVTLRNQIQSKNPTAWNQIVRNEIDRRLYEDKKLNKTKNYGSTFYDRILSNDIDFDKFYQALGDSSNAISPAQQTLTDMRSAFKGLINNRTGKKSSPETKMHGSKGKLDALGKAAQSILGGKYDKTAVAMITDPNWERFLNKDRWESYLNQSE